MAQWNKNEQDYLNQERTLFEVYMRADKYGTIYEDLGQGFSADAFGRLRSSTPFTLGDYKNLYSIDPDFVDVKSGVGATVIFDVNQSAAILQSGISTDGYCIHQTKRYHHYMPGKSQVVYSTFNFGAAQQNVTKRTGYFDDRDGIFFEQAPDGTLSFVIRSYVTAGIGTSERRIPQSQWNKDTLDGNGPSRYILDITKTQLFMTDFEWLGVGRVRCGFSIDGYNIIAHEFYNSNHIPTVYMSNPNLPVRCEIRNSGDQVGAGGSFIQICSTVMSEGGYTESGREFSHTTGLRPVGIGTTVPIMAIRLKNSFKGYPNRATVKLEDITVFSSGSNVKYEVVKLKSSTGINTTGEWISEHPESVVEYNITAVGISTTDFEDFMGGYAAGDSQNVQKPSATTAQVMSGPTSKKNFLSQNFYSNDSEIFSVRVSNIGNDPANVGVSMRWREIY
jgi:hypothetical protein